MLINLNLRGLREIAFISNLGLRQSLEMQNGGPGGTASNGVTLGPVTFHGNNKVAVGKKAKQVCVLCGQLCVRI